MTKQKPKITRMTYDADNLVDFLNRLSDNFPLNSGEVVLVSGFPNRLRLNAIRADIDLELGTKFPDFVHNGAADERNLTYTIIGGGRKY